MRSRHFWASFDETSVDRGSVCYFTCRRDSCQASDHSSRWYLNTEKLLDAFSETSWHTPALWVPPELYMFDETWGHFPAILVAAKWDIFGEVEGMWVVLELCETAATPESTVWEDGSTFVCQKPVVIYNEMSVSRLGRLQLTFGWSKSNVYFRKIHRLLSTAAVTW